MRKQEIQVLEENDSIDLRSKAFQEVLGEPPGWLLSWGITAICVGFIALVALGFFIKYPETVSAPITLETSDPPFEIRAPEMGRITNIISEDTIIRKNDVLARINDNSGNIETILALGKVVKSDNPQNKELPNLAKLRRFEDLDLGLIRTELLLLLQLYRGNTYSATLDKGQTINNFDKSIENINVEILNIKDVIIKKQKELADIPATRKSLQTAYSDNPSAENNALLRQLNEQHKNLKDDIKLLEGEIIKLEREIEDKKFQKSSLVEDIRGSQITRRQNLELQLLSLKREIENWKSKHLIKAPVGGKVVYKDKLKTNATIVDKGDKLFAIIEPTAQDSIIGKLFLTSEEALKIENGQKVKIKFQAFRPSEFGLLTGTVIDKGEIPENGQYQILVNLDDKMISTKGKTIKFEHEMRGNAQIITNDRHFTGIILEHIKEMLRRD